MDFQMIRMYGSIVVILGCFIFLYPKLLHPMVSNLMGWNTQTDAQRNSDHLPPPLRDKIPEGARDIEKNIEDQVRRMRGPHPGMRGAAQETNKNTKGSSRGGMMGVILPMYAVGIVIYLVYTLFKVFGKSDKNQSNQRSQRSPVRQPASRVQSLGSSPSADEGRVPRAGGTVKAGENSAQQIKAHLEELQRLAGSEQESDSQEMDMRKLQERLAETEAQMSKILAAMTMVQTKVSDVAGEEDTKTPKAGSSTGQSAPAKKSGQKEGDQANSVDDSDTSNNHRKDEDNQSTPESESYELVNKSDSSETSDRVETVKSAEDSQPEEEEEAEEVILDDLKKSDDLEDTSTVRKRVTTNADDQQS